LDDSEVIIKDLHPKIDIVIYSKNPNDQDWNKNHNPEDDSQTINKWEKWIFEVIVTNNWEEWLEDVYVESNVNSCSKSKAELLELIRKVWNKDDILDPDEQVVYTCEKDNIWEAETVNVSVIWIWIISKDVVDDDDPTKVIVVNNPSIKIEKYSWNPDDLDNNKDHNPADDSQTIKKWNSSIFEIKVTNTWVEDLVNVVITDEKAPNCNKTFDLLEVWDSKIYTCEKSDIIEDYTNIINVQANWKDSWKQTTSSDSTEIKVIIEPEVDIVIYSKNPNDLDWDKSHDPSDDSQKVKKWEKAVFEVVVTNPWVEW
jgi:hypothetical protein